MRRQFLVILATATMTVALSIGSSRAAIVSSDLQLWAAGASSTDTRSVIVQLASGLSGGNISGLFGNSRLNGDYKKLSMLAVSMSPADVARFAADSRVVALDFDRPVMQMGAAPFSTLQRVVGADVVRTNFSLDGNGIGVAVLDSGLASHLDFSNPVNVTMVPNSTTSDNYGHGTLLGLHHLD